MRRSRLLYVKIVHPPKAKGGEYCYFDTGQVKPNGRPILARLPARSDPSFGNVYATMLASRTKRAQRAAVLLIPRLVDLYERSPEFAQLADSTQRTYSIYLRLLVEQLAKAPANELTRQDVLLLRDTLGTRMGAANGLVRAIRALYAWGRYREHVAIDPCQGIELFPSKDYEPWPEELLDAALASDDRAIRFPVALLYYVAQRVGDTCELRWSDVRAGFIHVTQDKTGKPMEIKIHQVLADELASAPRHGMTILADAAGLPTDPGRLRYRLKKWASDRGYKIVPHGLRKNSVNAFLEAGCSTAETAAVTGQSLQMVEHYAKRRSGRRLSSAAVLKLEGGKA